MSDLGLSSSKALILNPTPFCSPLVCHSGGQLGSLGVSNMSLANTVFAFTAFVLHSLFQRLFGSLC